ncbi:MAG: NADP-dependent malic enzyme, partial [Pseudomonadota bacterium]
DVFLGLSGKGALTQEMVQLMADKPIIFAMANPDPEITPEEVKAVRSDAIIATGRSDYNNQVNNVMGFPYIFRGALDVRASTINDEMKIAAAESLAALAREIVPDDVSASYSGRKMQYGPDYIIPVTFDRRLITTIPIAVAKAAMRSGVARKPIANFEIYKAQLKQRLDPTANNMNYVFERVQASPQRIIFAEGEEEAVIRCAILWYKNGYGKPILVGREEHIRAVMIATLGSDKDLKELDIQNAAVSGKIEQYTEFLYQKLQRKGFLYRDCARLVKHDRNIFSACMLSCGDGDAIVTGLTRSYNDTLDDILKVIPQKKEEVLCGLSVMIANGKTVFIADTTVHELPTPEELADIAIQAAKRARSMGHTPRVALLSFSNFGNPMLDQADRIRKAVAELNTRKVDFEYDGEMSADVALNQNLMQLYPFCKLSGPANVLIMPALHSANVSSKLLQELGGGLVIGPILVGLDLPVQIVQMGSSVSDILNIAAFAAIDAILAKENFKIIL